MRNHLEQYRLYYLSALAALAGAILTWRFPVYFRGDDATYLAWAAEHANPLAAFSPSAAVLFGSYRPVQNLVWWALYRLFGLHPLPYQFFCTALFLFSFVAYFRLIEIMHSRRVAVAAIVAYGVAFSFLGYVVFWFSDLTFILEVLFLNLALAWLLRGCLDGGRALVVGGLFFVLAALAKEPSALIVPAVLWAYLWTRAKALGPAQVRRTLIVAAVLLAAGLLWVLVNPYVRQRQLWNPALDQSTYLLYARLRWEFYAKFIARGGGTLAVFATLYLALFNALLKSRFGYARSLAASILLAAFAAVVLRDAPPVALNLTMISLVIFAVWRHAALPGAVWFAVPLLGLVNVGYFARTYLIEASFGLALVSGIALAEWWSLLRVAAASLPRRGSQIAGGVAIAMAVLLAVASAPKIAGRLQTLQMVSDTRQSLREATDFVLQNLDQPGAALVVVDYADLGLDYVAHVLDLPDWEKAARQKTMTGEEYARFLRMAGATNITVRDFTWLKQNLETPFTYVLAMNQAEYEFARTQPLRLLTWREMRHGSAATWLLVPAGKL